MNVCIVSTFSCDFEEFKELFDLSNQVIGEWCSEAELIKVNDHKSIMLADVTDLDKLKEFMSAPEMLEWDKQNNCVDHVYSMTFADKLSQIANQEYLFPSIETVNHILKNQRNGSFLFQISKSLILILVRTIQTSSKRHHNH